MPVTITEELFVFTNKFGFVEFRDEPHPIFTSLDRVEKYSQKEVDKIKKKFGEYIQEKGISVKKLNWAINQSKL